MNSEGDKGGYYTKESKPLSKQMLTKNFADHIDTNSRTSILEPLIETS